MREARAVVAGVLCAVMVIIVMHTMESDTNEDYLGGLLAFVGIIVMLLGVDLAKAYHALTGRSNKADDDKEPD